MPFNNAVRALYSYEATDPDELSFEENDILFLIMEDVNEESDEKEGWLNAVNLKDVTIEGLIPANYVETVEVIAQCVAFYDYESQDQTELSFVENEHLNLLSKLDESEEWWLVKNQNNLVGLVPSNYIELVSQLSIQQENSINEEQPVVQNIFETPTVPIPEVKSSLKDLFPVSKVKKKWGAEYFPSLEESIKGKLYLMEGNVIVFVHGKGKIVEFHYKVSMILEYDRVENLIYLKDGVEPFKVKLSKNDSKDLSRILEESRASQSPKVVSPNEIIQEDLYEKENSNVFEKNNIEIVPEEDNFDNYESTSAQDQPSENFAEHDVEPAEAEEYLEEEPEEYSTPESPQITSLRKSTVSMEDERIQEVVRRSQESMEMLKKMNSSQTQLQEILQTKKPTGPPPAPPLPSRPSPLPNQSEPFAAVAISSNSNKETPPRAPEIKQKSFAAVPPPPPLPNRPSAVTDQDSDLNKKINEIAVGPTRVPPSPPHLPKTNAVAEESQIKYAKKVEVSSPVSNNISQDEPIRKNDTYKVQKDKKIDKKDHLNETSSVSHKTLPNPWSNVSLKKVVDKGQSNNKDGLNSMQTMSKALPSKLEKDKLSENKQIRTETRLWKDKSGKFQTEASYVGFENGKVILNKLNGTKVAVPIELLSERDSEYVFRKSGVDPSKYLPKNEQQTSPPKPNETFKVKGFDWLSFLIDCGVGSDRAVRISRIAVYAKLEESWLDNANRDRIREKLEVTEESECLLILQGITKRKLQRLEKLGQEKLLRSLASSNTANEPNKSQSNLQSNNYPVPTSRRMSPPLIPTPVMKPTSPINDKQNRSLSLSAAQIPLQKASLKSIPALKPENSLNSLEIISQPVIKQQSQGGFVQLPDGRIAQQQTMTHYMVRRATTGDAAVPPVQYQSNGYPPATYMPNGSVPPSYSVNPYALGAQQPQNYSQMPAALWSNVAQFNIQSSPQQQPTISVPPPPPPNKSNRPAIVPDPAALAAANSDKYSIFRKASDQPILPTTLFPPPPSGFQQNPPRPPYTGFGPN